MKPLAHILPLAIYFTFLFSSVCTQGIAPPFDQFFEMVKQQAQNGTVESSGSGLNPPLHPERWIALGDSYAAGPGAGDTIQDDQPDCVRGTDAYPPQMQNDGSMPGPEGIKPEFVFKACTGDKTKQMLDPENSNFQLGQINEFTKFVTLSIGGNDAGFAKILRACVYLPIGGPSCAEMLETAQKRIYDPEFFDRYTRVLQELVDRMRWTQRRSDWNTAIFQTGYAQFFDVYTTQCDSTGFIFGGGGVKMTQARRADLNHLAHTLNWILQYWIDLFNTKNTQQDPFNLYTTPVHFVNLDQFYSQHRFCREGVTEPDLNNAETFFFHMFGDPGPETMSQEEVDAAINEHMDDDKQVTINTPVWLLKPFHPTPAGFETTKYLTLSKFYYKYAARDMALGRRHFNLWVIGDYVPYASQDPNSDIYQGFIPHLGAILRDYRFYGFPQPMGYFIRPTFIGSRAPNNYNGEYHDCWQTATIEKLTEEVSKSPAAPPIPGVKGKVVALMAGTVDVINQIDMANIQARMKKLLDTIFEKDRDAVILLSQIPLIGFPEVADGKTWYPLQLRIVSFNAMLAELANEFNTRGWGQVWLVHSSATPLEHGPGDLILPNSAGYRRMAYDFAEAIVYAEAFHWFRGSEAPMPSFSPTKRNALLSSRQDGQLECSKRDNFKVEMGTKEEIRDSYLQGFGVDEFIEKVACNRTELCKISEDGVHGDPLQPNMLSLNATVCQRNGGKPGKAERNNLQFRMPSPDYDLEKSPCRDAVKQIIEECVINQDAVGGSWKQENGLYIIFQPDGLDRKGTELRPYEADFYNNDDMMKLLKDDVALPPPPGSGGDVSLPPSGGDVTPPPPG